jgi:tetratricopeptide (TPR) repeat protein
MQKIGWVLMLSVWLFVSAALAAEPAGGPGSKDEKTQPGSGDHAAGWFAAPAPAGAAVTELDQAQELMAQDGHEREALAAALKLITQFEQAKDDEHLAECLTLVGEGYYFTGDWLNTLKFMQRAWDTGTRAFGDEMSTYPLKVIGEAQFELKQYDPSLATFQQRLAILRQRADVEELAGALYDTASLLARLERYTEALPLLAEAGAANNKRLELLNAPDSGAKPEEHEAVTVDGAEIALLAAEINIQQKQDGPARTELEQALAAFNSLPAASQHEHADRMVSVLDHLVAICEASGDTTAAASYRAERDRLNQ